MGSLSETRYKRKVKEEETDEMGRERKGETVGNVKAKAKRKE